MITRLIIFIILIAFTKSINAQEVLLERDISESIYLKKKGPNKKRFMHFYCDFASYYSTGSNNSIYEDGSSFRSFIGLRRYYRITNCYITGLALEYGWERFEVEQDKQKTFPSSGTYDKEILGTSNIGIEYFNRLLITQREFSFGLWIDVGAYSNFNVNSRHVTKEKAELTDGAKSHKEINKGLKYVNDWEYGLKTRFGFKRYAIVGTYRLSDWLSGMSNNYEPPKFSIGVELGLY